MNPPRGSGTIVVLLILTLNGCHKKNKDTAPEPPGRPMLADPAGGGGARNDVQRGAERLVNQNLMQGIGRYCELYRGENGRLPRTLDDLKAYVRTDPDGRRVSEALDKGWVVVILDPPPSAGQVLAYEKDVYQKWNNRLVLFGDCNSVKLMDDGEFQQILQRK